MALIKLFADPEDGTLPPPPPLLRGGDFPIADLLLDLQYEREARKRREAGFVSVIAHLVLVVLLLTAKFWPAWLHLQPVTPRTVADEQAFDPKQFTYLEMPKDLITKAPPVKPKVLSDQDRHFDQPTKITDSLSNPFTPPKPAPPSGNPAPPAPQPQPSVAETQPAPQPQPAPPASSADKSAADSGLKLQDIPRSHPPTSLPFNVPTAGETLQRALENVAKNKAGTGPSLAEGGQLPRRGNAPGGNRSQGQAVAGAQILTDTQGVDFSSWLQRVVDTVRTNWYAVMPETVYLGTQGKVFIHFDVDQKGAVQGMTLIGPSGMQALDSAAWSAISASNPFPPLPSAFHGPSIALQFGFFYNLDPDQP